jgi:hypothetical protein
MSKEQKPLTTALTMKTADGQRARLDNLPPAVMQALYHQVTGKREKLTKAYNDNYIIRHSDIKNLLEKIEQTLAQFNYQATSTNVTVFHHDGEELAYSSWEKFNQYDLTKTEPISEIILEVEFLLAVPNVGKHQSYKISVDMQSYVLLETDEVPSTGIGNGYRGEDDDCIRTSIEYIDYVVARSFSAAIEDWAKGLEKSKLLGKRWSATRYLRWRSEELLTSIGAAATAFTTANIIVALQPTMPQPVAVALVGGAGVISYYLSGYLFNYAFNRLGFSALFPYIIINKGDKRNHGKFVERRERASKLGWLVLGTGVFGILAQILSRVILHKLGY